MKFISNNAELISKNYLCILEINKISLEREFAYKELKYFEKYNFETMNFETKSNNFSLNNNYKQFT